MKVNFSKNIYWIYKELQNFEKIETHQLNYNPESKTIYLILWPVLFIQIEPRTTSWIQFFKVIISIFLLAKPAPLIVTYGACHMVASISFFTKTSTIGTFLNHKLFRILLEFLLHLLFTCSTTVPRSITSAAKLLPTSTNTMVIFFWDLHKLSTIWSYAKPNVWVLCGYNIFFEFLIFFIGIFFYSAFNYLFWKSIIAPLLKALYLYNLRVHY